MSADRQNEADCIFCRILNSSSPAEWHDEPLYRRHEFQVVAGLGAQVEGYVLIVPREHRFSSAELSTDALERLQQVKQDVAHVLNQAYGPCVFFEHGACAPRNLAGGCVDHVHIHALPMNLDLIEFMRPRLPFEALTDPLDIASWRGRPYLAIETQAGELNVTDGSNLPGQYLRRVVDEVLDGRGEWDYTLFPHYARVKATIERLRPLFSSMWESNRDDTRADADLLSAKPLVYLARAVDHRPAANLVRVGEELRAEVQELGFAPVDPVVSPFPRLHDLPNEREGERNFGRIESDLAWLRRSDALLVDMSIEDWSYVGCVCELVYAHLWGIPSIVMTGNSNIAERVWLRYHATHIVKERAEAMERLQRLLPQDPDLQILSSL